MFFKRKGDKEKNYEEIKKSMGMSMEEPSEEFIEDKHEREVSSAPLFVKVEKYQNVLGSINEMRTFVSSMKQLFNVLYELETVRNESLKIMRAKIQRLEKTLFEIDNELLRPK